MPKQQNQRPPPYKIHTNCLPVDEATTIVNHPDGHRFTPEEVSENAVALFFLMGSTFNDIAETIERTHHALQVLVNHGFRQYDGYVNSPKNTFHLVIRTLATTPWASPPVSCRALNELPTPIQNTRNACVQFIADQFSFHGPQSSIYPKAWELAKEYVQEAEHQEGYSYWINYFQTPPPNTKPDHEDIYIDFPALTQDVIGYMKEANQA